MKFKLFYSFVYFIVFLIFVSCMGSKSFRIETRDLIEAEKVFKEALELQVNKSEGTLESFRVIDMDIDPERENHIFIEYELGYILRPKDDDTLPARVNYGGRTILNANYQQASRHILWEVRHHSEKFYNLEFTDGSHIEVPPSQ